MADISISAEEIARLAKLVEETGLSELRYESGDLRITLRTADYARASAAPPVFALPAGIAAPTAPAEGYEGETAAPADTATASDAATLRIEAPIMGVFYRTPAPDDPPFVEVGDTVEVGQVVGTIEAMKVFSEVLAEVSGRVTALPVKHGGLVQPGDALVILEAV